ncbi:hypothetical protein MIZ03_3286 [Rhodoferax lithotrophicus]|uniref:Uncharacterized protein n=1 Tax=Rhodoferax lithotrophicus TaxID=2798804 RepID=A0ABM7MQ63_9BURK|nr:hypothetical protein MIZ03_3286 [Rhodoferax sp. MIZ03]
MTGAPNVVKHGFGSRHAVNPDITQNFDGGHHGLPSDSHNG